MTGATELMEQLQEKLGTKLGNLARVRSRVVRAGLLKNSDLKEVALTLRDELGFNHANLMTATDYIDAFECVYHLSNIDNATMVELHLLVDHDAPKVPSLAMVWEGLDWHEREAYDLMGVEFTGHPNLKRILLPLDWEGHPLRKDYIYPIKEEEW